LEKSLAALRSELASQRAQSEKLASAINDVKSAPREAAPSVDLSAVNERIAQIERAARAQSAAIAQESSKPADDVPLRRLVAAALLDVLVRIGDPYPAALAAAKSLAANPDALKPLEGLRLQC
jgi:septal ring factor EnvC (AmiA/AmiB activator)